MVFLWRSKDVDCLRFQFIEFAVTILSVLGKHFESLSSHLQFVEKLSKISRKISFNFRIPSILKLSKKSI